MKKKKKTLDDFYNDEEQDIKSKTQIKAEMSELQDLGKAIAELPKSVYKSFNVPDALDEAIQTLHRIKNWNAQKRQHQYIGRVMREIGDDEETRLRRLYDDYTIGRKKLNREFHKLEETRTALIEGDQSALQTLLDENPNIERQQLMQIIRSAQKEIKQNATADQGNKQDKQFKKLFQFLKTAIKENS